MPTTGGRCLPPLAALFTLALLLPVVVVTVTGRGSFGAVLPAVSTAPSCTCRSRVVAWRSDSWRVQATWSSVGVARLLVEPLMDALGHSHGLSGGLRERPPGLHERSGVASNGSQRRVGELRRRRCTAVR